MPDFPRGYQFLHCAHRLCNGMGPAPPMKKIYIEVICPQPLQAGVTCSKGTFIRSVRWKDFADEKNLVPISTNDLRHDFFRTGIHLRGIDVRHPKLDDGMQRVKAIVSDLPGSLADDRDLYTGRTEVTREHDTERLDHFALPRLKTTPVDRR